MNRKVKSIIYIISGIVVIFLILNASGIFGVPVDRLEQDARKSQKIDASWDVSKADNDEIGALLFYSKQADKFVFSIYLNRPGLSYGYFFRSGGAVGDIMDGVAEFSYGSNGAALISMNKPQISKIEFGNEKLSTMEVDPLKPFAVTLPKNCDSFAMYDINGEVIPVTNVFVNN
jgi:hypothetical protein